MGEGQERRALTPELGKRQPVVLGEGHATWHMIRKVQRWVLPHDRRQAAAGKGQRRPLMRKGQVGRALTPERRLTVLGEGPRRAQARGSGESEQRSADAGERDDYSQALAQIWRRELGNTETEFLLFTAAKAAPMDAVDSLVDSVNETNSLGFGFSASSAPEAT